tara:strand:+ start:22 stop:597 length:576 start_codon:yes stop_codon:yes gene_type:complete
MVKKDKVKPVKKRVVKKVVKQTQTQKQTVVVNIDTKKAPIRRRRAPTTRQKEPSGIARFIRMNEPPQTLMNTGALGMNIREPLKNIGDYSQMGLGERTDAQRQQEMLDNNMKFLDKLERDNRKEPVDLGRETESDKATTLPSKIIPSPRGRPRIIKTEEQKEEDKRRRVEKQREKRQRKKEEKEREKKQNM